MEVRFLLSKIKIRFKFKTNTNIKWQTTQIKKLKILMQISTKTFNQAIPQFKNKSKKNREDIKT